MLVYQRVVFRIWSTISNTDGADDMVHALHKRNLLAKETCDAMVCYLHVAVHISIMIYFEMNGIMLL